jgi:hypothetical protein
MDTPRTPTAAALLLAVLADCDPRTAARALRGEDLRGRVGERIARALREHPEIAPNATATPEPPQAA